MASLPANEFYDSVPAAPAIVFCALMENVQLCASKASCQLWLAPVYLDVGHKSEAGSIGEQPEAVQDPEDGRALAAARDCQQGLCHHGNAALQRNAPLGAEHAADRQR